MAMRSIALFKVGRDYGVTFLDLKIAGLRDTASKPSKYEKELRAIEEELIGFMPKLREMYAMDTVLEDTAGRNYLARFYTYGGVIYYALLISPKNTLRTTARKLASQGWRLLVMIEKKAVKKTPSETDAR